MLLLFSLLLLSVWTDYFLDMLFMQIVEVVLRQGLVHPITCVPYLIALETDPLEVNQKLAHHLLMNMNEKYFPCAIKIIYFLSICLAQLIKLHFSDILLFLKAV